MENNKSGQRCHQPGILSLVRFVTLASVLLTGCEAPLVLDGVEARRAEPIHRMDRYQAAARHNDDVVVVGNQGVILHSPDQGTSWTRQVLEGWPALVDVTACPDGTFVALAYDKLIYVSTDSGASWTAKPINDTSETPQSVTCAPDGRLWIVGSFTFIWSSSDLGESWTETSRDEDAILTTVQFLDATTGFITGEFGVVLKTTDGGEYWEALPSLPDEFYPEQTYFADSANGWVVGLGGVILHTSDGGMSWQEQQTGTQVSLFGIENLGDAIFVVGGEGTMLRLTEGSWQPVNHGKPVRLYLRAIQALDEQRLLIGGIGGALHVFNTDGA